MDHASFIANTVTAEIWYEDADELNNRSNN